MPPKMRSAERLGMTLAVTGSPKDKAATRLARLRETPPGGFLWKETAEEFEMYREVFPKPQDICVTCLRDGSQQVVKGSYEYIDGWGTKGWVRTCPVHGKNPPVKQVWSIASKEKRVFKAATRVIFLSRHGRKGKPPVRDETWNDLGKNMTTVFSYLKTRRASATSHSDFRLPARAVSNLRSED